MSKCALLDVEHAFKQLEFAIKLMCYCERGDLDRGKFDSDITIQLDEENIGFPNGSFQSDRDIITASQVNVSICFGVTAIVLDALFEEAEIEKKPKSGDPKDELRTLVYMVRCAFAHNSANPCWKVIGKNYARTFQLNLDGKILHIDMKDLHKKAFEYRHIGGFPNWYKIKKIAVQMVVAKLKTGE